MSTPPLSAVLHHTFISTLGLRECEIVAAMDKPDRLEGITGDGGLEVWVSMKNSQRPKLSAMVVVAAIRPKPMATLALKLYNDFPQDLPAYSPLELLERAAWRFGADVTIGGITKKFFLRHDIPVQTTNAQEVFGVQRRPGHAYHGTQFFRITDGQPPMAACTLVAVWDVDAYHRYLKRF
ncbi:MAG TPA: hypothetical protein VJN62_02805 [Gemmatimonadales bacterium]|nr:hypothetical protein [Gemmatimonadales bacterium]